MEDFQSHFAQLRNMLLPPNFSNKGGLPYARSHNHPVVDRMVISPKGRHFLVDEKNLWGILDMRHRNSHQRESQFLAPE